MDQNEFEEIRDKLNAELRKSIELTAALRENIPVAKPSSVQLLAPMLLGAGLFCIALLAAKYLL